MSRSPAQHLASGAEQAPRGALWAAIAATAIGVLPVFFFGAVATLVRDDLHFRQSQIGLTTAAFFATGALLSVPGGWLAERLGEIRTAALATVFAVCSMLGVAVLARSWAHLLSWLILGGTANALAQPASNAMLAGTVSDRRKGLVFGTKQAAVPLASMVAGLGPALALTLGWRGAFGAAAALGLPVLVLLWIARGPRHRAVARSRPSLRGSKDLLALAVVAALGAGTGNAMGAFYVDAAVGRNVSVGTAGLFLATSSGIGIVARIGWGWSTDRWRVNRMLVIAVLLVAGAGGYAIIAVGPAPLLLLLGTVVAYAAGWGWNGLLVAVVVDAHPDAPAAATGVTQAGVYGGAVLVPPLFGYLAEVASYAVAWTTAAGLLCAAACLAAVAARWHAPARLTADEAAPTRSPS